MSRGLFWFRRDLRLEDNLALSEASKNCDEVYLVFVFDDLILKELKDKSDQRLSFIIDSLKEIESNLEEIGGSIIIEHGDPNAVIPNVVKKYKINNLYFNRDYEPYAKARDKSIEETLKAQSVGVNSYKDSVIFESKEILNGSGDYYKVFTSYKNKWLSTFNQQFDKIPNYKTNLSKLAKINNKKSILNKDWYKEIGFNEEKPVLSAGRNCARKRLIDFQKNIGNYNKERDFPYLNSTSLLSVYIRHGNISIREMMRCSLHSINDGSKVWQSELIWRDFYQMVLDTNPNIIKSCYKKQYDSIQWEGNKKHFELWCNGQTGTPIVDAAMRCLNQTGLMHNRLRMIVASFFCKTLLLDWKIGERYFASKLLDYDLAANNGGWQWAASTGCDAAPYFRIFNPYRQSERFDGKGEFIKKWCPELSEIKGKNIHRPQANPDKLPTGFILNKNYPKEIVHYETQRERCLEMFKSIKA